MRASFAQAPAPVVVSVIKERTVKDAIGAIRNSEYAGAGAFDLHLSTLDPEFKNVSSIGQILQATSLPVLALNYNHTYEFETYTSTEEERIALLRMGAEAGASAVDMQGYSFDPAAKETFPAGFAAADMAFARKNPREVALAPEAVAKQTAFIREMHDRGTEVLISCHTGVYLNTEEALSLAKLFEARGADVLKFVMPCDTDEQLAEQFTTLLTLKRECACAVHLHCGGARGRITRIVNPMLGSHLSFCVERFGVNQLADQLDLRAYSEALRLLRIK